MGLILSLIKQEKEIPFVDISFNATRKDLEPTITVDLEKHLELLKSYSGCAEEIRSAISQPNPQSEENAYKVLVPAIQKLQQLYEFCQSVEQAITQVVVFLCQEDVTARLSEFQHTTQQLALLLCFCIHFDILKLQKPQIQNDFSFYRRGKRKLIPDELANRMSLFFANGGTGVKVCMDAIQSTSQGPNKEKVFLINEMVEMFVVLSGLGYHLSKQSLESNPPAGITLTQSLQLMTISMMVYDNLTESLFVKEGRVAVKKCIAILKQVASGSEKEVAEACLGMLKFGSRTGTTKGAKMLE